MLRTRTTSISIVLASSRRTTTIDSSVSRCATKKRKKTFCAIIQYMKLLVGLGNPGPEYNFTRHNFGFLTLDFYAKIKDLTWQKPKFNAIWLKTGDQIWIKPQTFYNNSGQSVQAFMRFYKISPQDILVICDDFDLNFGTLRYRAKGTSGGNNGLKSITDTLHTTDFPRLRLGSNNPTIRQKTGDINFVLGKFTPDEKSQLPTILQDAVHRIQEVLN